MVKNSPALQEPQETWVPSLASGRSPGGGHGNPRPCSYLENPVDREAPWATVHGVTESDTMEVTWQARTHLPLDHFLFFNCLIWAVLSLHCCAQVFSSCGRRGPVAARGGSVVVARGFSCPVACGIFPHQGPNPRPLHWQADFYPLDSQGSPEPHFLSARKKQPGEGAVCLGQNLQPPGLEEKGWCSGCVSLLVRS